MQIIGLTGGIATGKSTVSRFLQELGAVIIDADRIAREVVEPGEEGWLSVRRQFGTDYLTEQKQLNRAKLAKRIFGDPEARIALNNLLHPLIKKRIQAEIIRWQKEKRQPKLLVVDAPLLLETNLQELVDEIWVVFCDFEKQSARLQKRNGISAVEAVARIEAQMQLAEKKKQAHVLLANEGDILALQQQVRELWEQR